MNNIEFDKKIKELADSYSEPVNDGLWVGIEKGLARRRRVVILKRVGYYAAAACVAVGLLLFIPQRDKDAVITAKVEQSVEKTVITPQIEESTPIVNEKITKKASLKSNRIAVVPKKELVAQVAVDKKETPQEVETLRSDTSAVEVAEKPVPSKKENKQQREYKTISEQIAENGYLAMNVKEEKDGLPVILSASSNLLAIISAADGDFRQPRFSPGAIAPTNYGVAPISQPMHSIPLSFGIQFQVPFSERLSLGVGINYTLLNGKYEALINSSLQSLVEQNLHYIGLPVTCFYTILQNNRVKFYTHAGVMTEKGLHANFKMKDLNDDVTYMSESIKGLQWSSSIGAGVEIKVTKLLGLYLDPSLAYFFKNNQPYSIRTEQPLQLKLELGLRFHL